MTLRKKIWISNILMVCVPLVAALLLWLLYVNTLGQNYVEQYNTVLSGSSSFSGAQRILYVFDKEVAKIDWSTIEELTPSQPDYIPSNAEQHISELSEAGFHLQISHNDKILFSNLDGKDEANLTKADISGTYPKFFALENCSVISDTVQGYDILAVYNESRATMSSSFVPFYMISPIVIFAFIIILALAVIAANFILTGWLNRSVLAPLDILKNGSKAISEGDLDYRLEYEKKDEFGEVCREFDLMRGKLKSAENERRRYDDYKNNLLLGISHDLRSPLTSIRGYAEGLRDGIANDTEKRDRYSKAILNSTENIEKMLSAMSTLTKLESTEYQIQLTKTNLNEFIVGFINDLEEYSQIHHIDIEYNNKNKAAIINLNTDEMRRVFVNLLDNTVKYRTENHSVITIDVENSADSMIEIRFADDGTGVPEDKIGYIFESFYRADEARTQPQEGNGLGLAIVKRIVEAHGGSIKAYNHNGLTISMCFPL